MFGFSNRRAKKEFWQKLRFILNHYGMSNEDICKEYKPVAKMAKRTDGSFDDACWCAMYIMSRHVDRMSETTPYFEKIYNEIDHKRIKEMMLDSSEYCLNGDFEKGTKIISQILDITPNNAYGVIIISYYTVEQFTGATLISKFAGQRFLHEINEAVKGIPSEERWKTFDAENAVTEDLLKELEG